jgi:5-hydroxyisourate hydrolase
VRPEIARLPVDFSRELFDSLEMISTHILDTSTGSPAAEVTVLLEKLSDSWGLIQKETTNTDGRIAFQCPKEPGVYRLTFGIQDYQATQGRRAFFLDIPITFEITDTTRKYHIPLLLSPYGLSTYRGS